jgi:hypothetical protein
MTGYVANSPYRIYQNPLVEIDVESEMNGGTRTASLQGLVVITTSQVVIKARIANQKPEQEGHPAR